jgi:hypothetical protein
MTDYPIARHDPADWDREYLLDVAAAAKRDSWPLVGCRDLVEAICRDYGAIALELQDRGSEHRGRAALTDERTPGAKRIGGTGVVPPKAPPSIPDLVRHGHITPDQGARLCEVRQLLAWRRRPWWDRLITRLLGGGP